MCGLHWATAGRSISASSAYNIDQSRYRFLSTAVATRQEISAGDCSTLDDLVLSVDARHSAVHIPVIIAPPAQTDPTLSPIRLCPAASENHVCPWRHMVLDHDVFGSHHIAPHPTLPVFSLSFATVCSHALQEVRSSRMTNATNAPTRPIPLLRSFPSRIRRIHHHNSRLLTSSIYSPD